MNPRGTPIAAVAPTTVNAILECPQRVAFQRDPQTRGLSRPSTRTALGQVSHRITELVLKGCAPAPEVRKAWLEEQWEFAIADQAAALAKAWPGRPIPPPERWPGYVATRTRLLRRLATYAVAGSPDAVKAGATGGGQPPLPWVERKLTDEGLGLYGTPDLVEERHGVLRVVDLKSGVHQHDIQESQRRQLLLYAHLVTKALGREVGEVAVIDVRGQETVLPIAEKEIAQAVSAAANARKEFNESVTVGEVPARPGRESCRFCPFKVVCVAYRDARQDDWGVEVLAGTVTDMLMPKIATITAGETSARLVLTGDEVLKVGDQVAVTGLEAAGKDTFRLRWDARIRIA